MLRPRLAPALIRLTLTTTLLVLSTACLRVETSVEVEDDGSGTVTLVQAIDASAIKSFADQFGQSLGATPTSSSSSAPLFNEKDIDRSKLPPGTKVEAYKDGSFEGVKLTSSFQKPEEALATLNRLTSSLSGQTSSLSSLGGPSSGGGRPGATPAPASTAAPSSGTADNGFRRFNIEKRDGGWSFDAVVEPFAPSDPAADAMTQALFASVLKDASVTVKVKLPGNVVQTNADSVKGSEMTWNLPLTLAQPKTLSAKTAGSGGIDGDGGFPILIVVIVLVAVAAVAGLYLLSRRRDTNSTAG